MTEHSDLRPATPEEIAEALSFALRFNGRRPFPQANSLMAEITAAHLVEHLQRCGFQLMKGRTRSPRVRAITPRPAAGARQAVSGYAELQVTSNYSFLRGASHVEELMAQAKFLGLPAIGITDRNTLAGVARAHQRATEAGIRLVVGCRLDLRDHLPVLVYPTDRAAYARLCRLLSIGKGRAGKGGCELRLAGPCGAR